MTPEKNISFTPDELAQHLSASARKLVTAEQVAEIAETGNLFFDDGSGSTVDSNGVKIAVIRGSWAHATHFTGYRVVNGAEYVGWVNSHGARYKTSDEGELADMCWMTRALVEQFVSTASGYGSPYVVIPESVFNLDRSLYVKLRVPFPTNWRF